LQFIDVDEAKTPGTHASSSLILPSQLDEVLNFSAREIQHE
jgi:hypothetical protein